MSISYSAVGWNRQKKIYDGLLLGGVILYLAAFIILNGVFHPDTSMESSLVRASGTAAIILLHIILCIGPLCRLEKRFLPLLYNRRHMGVTMFVLALVHGGFVIMLHHSFGDLNPLVSIFAGNNGYDSLASFPFQTLGFIALVILFLMAATSHDFWLANLTAPIWKGLHMMVYLAYGLLIAHVILGVLQEETSPVFVALLGLGMVLVLGLHLAAGLRERRLDALLGDGEFVDVCSTNDIRDNRAKIVTLSGERVAVFKYDGKISAMSNVCRHQNGPLGEGKVVDGCVTCPWHGYQYKPETGASPPPFEEKVPTFQVKLQGNRVLIHPKPKPPGTFVEPAVIETTNTESRGGLHVQSK